MGDRKMGRLGDERLRNERLRDKTGRLRDLRVSR